MAERLATAGVLALIASAPWVYGGVEAWFRALAAAVLAAGCALAAVGVLLCGRTPAPSRLVVPLLPLAGLAVLAGLQVYGGVIPAEPGAASGWPQSVYPAATRSALAGLAAAIAAGLLGGILFSGRGAFHLLLACCLTAGAAVAFGGVAMQLTGEDRVIRGLPVVGDPFARFVNRNNAAAFLLIGLASGLALLRSAARPRPGDDRETCLALGWRTVDRTTVVWTVVALISLCLAGIVSSRSRGGTLAAGAAILAGLAAYRGRDLRRRAAVLLAAVLMAAGLVGWLGLSSRALERFQALSPDALLRDGRVPNWRNAARAAAARPVFGSGLGAYGYSYEEFAVLPSAKWFEHADDQYVELAVEAGAAGFGLLAAGAVFAALRFTRGSADPVGQVLLASLVAGEATHALFDYGVIVPAVALPAAALWGAVTVRLAGEVGSRFTGEPVAGPTRGRLAAAGLAACAAAGLVWAYGEHRSAWAVARWSPPAESLDEPGAFRGPDLDRLIEGLSGALLFRPDDAAGHRSLARLYVYRYRMSASEQLRRVDATISAQDAWRATSLSALRRSADALARSGAVAGLDVLRRDPTVQRDLVPARRHFRSAARACPRMPGTWIPSATLAILEPGDRRAGADEAATAARLFPTDGMVQRTAAGLAWQAGDRDLASRCWQAAFRIDPNGYANVVEEIAGEFGAEMAVRFVTPQDPAALLRLARDPAVRERPEIRNALAKVLAARAGSGTATGRALSALAAWYAGHADADGRFAEAVRLDPQDGALRADRATFWHESGRLTEAIDELRLAAELSPESGRLRDVLSTWTSGRGRLSSPRLSR